LKSASNEEEGEEKGKEGNGKGRKCGRCVRRKFGGQIFCWDLIGSRRRVIEN